MLYSSNIVKAQNAIGNSTSPYGGWLFHTHSITIGSEIQPQNTLHINKKTSTGINYIQITNEAGGSGIFTGKSSTDGFLIGLDGIGYEKLGISINQQEHSYIRFLTTNTERMRISQDGFVGIGTTNLSSNLFYKLTVKGKILAEEVEVVPNVNAPDYVFKDDYELISIYELEKFVNENSHLPEIPSADDITKNNLKLGEMNFLLLKKVEELTLYIIDLQKQIDELKRE